MWKRRFEKLEQECSKLKGSVEMAHNLIQDESSTWKSEIVALKCILTQQSTDHSGTVQIVKVHGSQLKNINEMLKGVNNRIDMALEEQQKLNALIQNMKMKMDEALGAVDFPVKKMLVCQNVWHKQDEDLMKVAKLIVNTTLELPDIKILNVECKSGFKGNAGLVKIEIESENVVKEVLRQKRKLKNAPAKELREVFLRKSKSQEALVSERNQDIILQEIGIRNEYIRLPTGHLTKKSNRYGNTGGRGSRGGCGGRGAGRSGRTQRRGYSENNNGDNEPEPNLVGTPPADMAANTTTQHKQDMQIEELLR